jgi:hypothetical protein
MSRQPVRPRAIHEHEAVASRWWWKSGRAWFRVVMLRGGGDRLGVGLVGGWSQKVSA